MNERKETSFVAVSMSKGQDGFDKLRKELINLSVKGLMEMFDSEKQIFHYKVSLANGELIKEGHSLRYTIISLLGLYKYEKHISQSTINIRKIIAHLIDNIRNIDNIGDLGLLIWLCALASPEKLAKIYHYLDSDNILITYQDAREIRTMELSWYLTGLAYTALNSKEYLNKIQHLANRTHQLILSNYGDNGIFGHQKEGTLIQKLRSRLGSFADQVYPIYALTLYSKAFNNEEALNVAVNCAKKICRLQGPLGQWWWHYDAITGRVNGRYPVYSVHQDGMAPMALFAVAETSGYDFDQHIYKGLTWINGNNELNENLIDKSMNLIWRSYYQSNYKLHMENLSSLFHINLPFNGKKDLKINFECRPYHLGWLLYAFAPKLSYD